MFTVLERNQCSRIRREISVDGSGGRLQLMYMSAVHFEREGGASMMVLCDTLISLSLCRRESVSGSDSRALCDASMLFTAAHMLQGFCLAARRGRRDVRAI